MQGLVVVGLLAQSDARASWISPVAGLRPPWYRTVGDRPLRYAGDIPGGVFTWRLWGSVQYWDEKNPPISAMGNAWWVVDWPRQCHQEAHQNLQRFLDEHKHTVFEPATQKFLNRLREFAWFASKREASDRVKNLCCRAHWDEDAVAHDGFFDARANEHASGQLCWDMRRPGRAFFMYSQCCHPTFQALISHPTPQWLLDEIRPDIDATIRGGFVRMRNVTDTHQSERNRNYCRVRVAPEGVTACRGWESSSIFGIKVHWVVRSLDVASHLRFWTLPPIEFYVSGNFWDDGVALRGPTLTTSSTRHGGGYLRIPRFCLSQLDRFVSKELWPTLTENPEFFAWWRKKDQMVWRGDFTYYQTKCDCGRSSSPRLGCNCSMPIVESFEAPGELCEHVRCRAVELSHRHPEDYDFRFSSNRQRYTTKKHNWEADPQWVSRMPLHEMLQYRYTLDVEGSYMSTMRPYWLLLSTMLVFRQVSELRIFGYEAMLRPFVHYIPVKEDLSDLPERLAWARAHPDESYQIVLAAQKFGHAHFSREYGMYYIYTVVSELAKAVAESGLAQY